MIKLSGEIDEAVCNGEIEEERRVFCIRLYNQPEQLFIGLLDFLGKVFWIEQLKR